MAQAQNTGDDNLQAIEETLSKSEQFIENNSKKLTIGLIVVLAIVGLFVAYQKWYAAPLEEEAHKAMFVAEEYFAKDSFQLAVDGRADFSGFVNVIDNYGSTKSGNLAKYYAGISYIKLKDYDKAIQYLSDFSSSDKMISNIALGNIGDAYSQKNEMAKAAEYYKKAANGDKNEFTAPIYLMKLGKVQEGQKNWKEALDTYNKIKKNYASTTEGRSIDKYITRVESNM